MNLSKLYTVSLLCLLMLGLSTTAVLAQTTVTGVVTAANDGMPIPGANVVVKGTSNGTITDLDGKFSITAEKGQTLLFSFIGYADKELIYNGEKTLNVVLDQNTEMLADVVVVGYGTMKKTDLTGSVASVSGETLEKVSSNRPVEAMQGRVAGVAITKSSGTPGAGMKVRIRGVGSTNNSDPLYVIDGVPSGNDMEHIAPEDIKSIEVLKDASATAIYGNKGANGVIIVTTKSGDSSSKPVFSFNTYYGVAQLAKKVDVLDASQQAQLILEAAGNDGISIPSDLESRINYTLANNYKGTDWQDEIFRVGSQQNYNLSVRGGLAKGEQSLNYSISGTYYKEEGILENSNFEKMILNARTEFKFNSHVKAGLQLNLFGKGNGSVPLGLYGGPIPLAMRTSPMDAATGADGEFIAMGTALGTNPAMVVDHMKYADNKTSSLGLRSWLDISIIDGLSFKSTINLSRGFTQDQNYQPVYYLNENFNRAESQLYQGRGDWNGWTWINLISFNKTINDIHKVNATLGHEASYNKSEGFSGTGINVPEPESLRYLGLAKSYRETLGAWQNQTGTESFFARAFYSFNNKYLFTATVRYDGSSKFSGDNQWGMFPSVGASWRLSEEDFIKNMNIFSNFKVRAGWGRVGNQASAQAGSDVANIGNYGMYYVLGGVTYKGGAATNIPTPDLRWEIVETTNIGLDLGFLNGDLDVTLDYFIKNTKDMITRVALPGYFPKDKPNANIGTMSNTGAEIALTYRNKIGNVDFSVGGNITFLKNEVTKLNSDDAAYIDGGFIDKLGNTTRTEQGREIAYFYGYKTDGIFRTQAELDAYVDEDGLPIQPNAKIGDVRFVDTNGNGSIDADDRQYLGSGTPDLMYGLNFSVGYKGFDLSGNIFGVYGNELVNGMGIYNLEVTDYRNALASRMDRFHPENNPNGTEPRVTLSNSNDNTRFSDRYVENGSYLRLKNLQIGYTLPKEICQRAKLDKVRIYVSGQNLWTLTDYSGYDPEVGDLTFAASDDASSLGIGVDLGNYPQPRLYLFGVNLTF